MMWSTRIPLAVPQDRVDHGPEWFIAPMDELVGTPRRLRPVLAELVELIRRRARGDAQREDVLHRPCIGSVRVDPHGEIVHDAELHARPHGGRLRGGQLVVELPLQPPVKIDGVGVLGGERGDRWACGGTEFLRPAVPVRSVPFCQRTPGREGVKAGAFAFAVCLVGQLAACGSLNPVDAFEHIALGGPRRVPVDQVRAPGVPL